MGAGEAFALLLSCRGGPLDQRELAPRAEPLLRPPRPLAFMLAPPRALKEGAAMLCEEDVAVT